MNAANWPNRERRKRNIRAESPVSELRINYGPGYRVYFKRQGRALIILLAGGNKNTQAKDIKAALRLARHLSE